MTTLLVMVNIGSARTGGLDNVFRPRPASGDTMADMEG